MFIDTINDLLGVEVPVGFPAASEVPSVAVEGNMYMAVESHVLLAHDGLAAGTVTFQWYAGEEANLADPDFSTWQAVGDPRVYTVEATAALKAFKDRFDVRDGGDDQGNNPQYLACLVTVAGAAGDGAVALYGVSHHRAEVPE